MAAEQFSDWKALRPNQRSRATTIGTIRVYTTRPDTLYGATYMVIAPEHPLVKTIVTSEQAAAVKAYCDAAAFKSDRDRTDGDKKKTGVFTGAHAINPVTGKPIPVWIADYVLIGYGTGAIMAVPAHDDRDFEFAQAYKLPIVCVVKPESNSEDIDAILAGKVCYTGPGKAMNSGAIDGLDTDHAKANIIESLSQQRDR
jgi:leucyl-tRNA synthetase